MPEVKSTRLQFRAPAMLLAKLERIRASRGDSTYSQTLRAMITLWPDYRRSPVVVESEE